MARSQKVEFTGSHGETLAARLERPNGPAKAYALFAHCFSCSKDFHAAQRIARRLAEAGYAVLRFDFTGLGQSEGDFANTNFTSNVQDLVKAADFLRENHEAPKLLIGHSLGGAAVIAAEREIPEVKAVATLAAPADADHVRKHFLHKVDEIEAEGEAEVELGGRPFRIRKQFLDDIEGHALDDIVAGMDAALLVAHSPVDETVGIENATRLFVAAKHPKSFLSLDHADHLISEEACSRHAADVIAAWAERYVGRPDWMDAAVETDGERCATVQETGAGKFHSWAVTGEHRFVVDEPEKVGGLDGGPHPYQLLCSALAACTTMTLRMYADRKGLEVGRIGTRVTHERDSDGPAGAKTDIFHREIYTEADVDAEVGDKLVEIANKCPVHRTLERSSTIETSRRA
ncbi:osmotically inducible protein C [Marinicauda salina]|uniref:Osmotically inducible protein C n=1 Tax=Marinicauda salina TaxID=2135793 RepID=A0A2U2BSN6_9PROT|nr:alpha/beta fold hydrolase [Marinicauda salina]PWE17035.1 osmotically inducible protein C [Marinicauda salina]